MVQKRPLDEDERDEVSYKQPRHLETNDYFVSALKIPSEAAGQNHVSGEGDIYYAKNNTECDGNLNYSHAELPFCPKKDVPTGSFPSPYWASTSEEDAGLEAPHHVLLSPERYNFERLPRSNVHSEDIYTFLLDYPPQKLVCVGPDFQADIPEYVEINFSEYENKLSGKVVIAMPDLKALTITDNEFIGVGRVDCSCEDDSSVTCVQRHVLEARDKLKRTIGAKTFAELGFCDMGETVAEKWSEDEEHLFHEVVFSNPASLGENFWDHLATAFPSRTKKEIISYYFNVFMLRRRAEQNRLDSINIDSDNDECLGILDSEVEVDENEDVISHETRGHDIQNGSPTLDGVHNEGTDNCEQRTSHFSGHEFMLEACDAREWEVECLNCKGGELDLLPTCSMIEEVFGVGSWNYKARDGRGLS